MKRVLFILLLVFLNHFLIAQPRTDSFLQKLFATNSNTTFNKVIQYPDSFRLQIIYTQINRDKNNKPIFSNYYFHYDSKLYFNPASMVKMPLAFLALEKLNQIKQKNVDKYTTIQIDSSQPWQHPLHKDLSAKDSLPSIAHFIRRAFLISENDPYNRLYQFIGQQTINQNLHNKGYEDARITRQFLGLSTEQNRYTNGIRFINKNGKLLYAQPPAFNTDSFDFSQSIKVGKGYLNSRDSLVNEPFDFTKQNNLSLGTMQQLLQSVLFPESMDARQRFNLTKDDYNFLYRYLSQYPSETPFPKYDTTEFYDSYVKFYFRDSSRKIPPNIRVFNKVGWSYGFMTDVSYVVDFTNKAEFMLAATLYVNSDGILNDDKYEYNTIAHPFLYQLGQTIYEYELQRKKPFLPNLSRFKIQYEKRVVTDTRLPLTEIDN